jgi:hypothetical protein
MNSWVAHRSKLFSPKSGLIAVFFSLHVLFALLLGRFFGFAPDEYNYLYTFENLFGQSADPFPERNSGWITAPKIFLHIVYFPAEILFDIGVPSHLALRILSIAIVTICFSLLIGETGNNHLKDKKILIFFLIPSVFLWTTIGMREPFILLEIVLLLVGIRKYYELKSVSSTLLIFVGSYSLLSTKNYLWVICILAIIIGCSISVIGRVIRIKSASIIVAISLLLPVAIYLTTSSSYALNFIFNSNVSAASERSGDSISYVVVEGTSGGTSGEDAKQVQEVLTFHGDYSLIAMHSYLENHPNSIMSKMLGILGLTTKINLAWERKIKLGLISTNNQVGDSSSSLNGHILSPGKLSNPGSILSASANFLFGPYPFIGSRGFAVGIASLESPLWWVLYLIVFRQIISRDRRKILDPSSVISLLIFLGFVFMSALIEVNLGTSFRHRSIVLVPLIFLYVRNSSIKSKTL